MALTEVLRITHSVHVDVEAVDGKVGDVGDKVQSVGERVQIVIDGAQGMSNYRFPLMLYF